MAVNDFLPFGTAGGANVESQADYLAAYPGGTTGLGMSSGVASSPKFNKVWRQAAFIASCVAKFVSDTLVVDTLDDGDQAGFIAKLKAALISVSTPTGCVIDFAGAAAPAGFLLCNGQSVLRADYPALFTAIGVTFGSVDGTHFNVPDLRGRTVAGLDQMAAGAPANRVTNGVSGIAGNTLGAAGGDQSMQQHVHAPSIYADAAGTGSIQVGWYTDTFYITDGSAGNAHTTHTATAGAGNYQNMMPVMMMNKVIKT